MVSCFNVNKRNEFDWTLEKERVHNENRKNPAKIDLQTWMVDTDNIKITGKPLINGVFPIPDYDLADSTFIGVGSSGDWKVWS